MRRMTALFMLAAGVLFSGVLAALPSQAASSARTEALSDPYPQFLFKARDRVNPRETILSRTNVSGLTTRWVHAFRGGNPYAAPVVDEGLVFEPLYSGTVEALNAATGRIRWTYRAGTPMVAGAAVTNSSVFVGDYNGTIRALNAQTGALLWSGKAGTNFFDSQNITVSGGVAYAVTGSNPAGPGPSELSAWGTFGCGASVCSPLWSAQVGGQIEAGVAVDGSGAVFVESGDGYLYAFAAYGCGAHSCGPLWRGVVTGVSSRAGYGSLSISDGIVYVGGQNSPVKAFRVDGCGMALCQPAWGYDSGTIGQANVAVDHGLVYVGAAGGLEAFDALCPKATVCEPVWTDTAAPSAAPLVANGVVYANSTQTTLLADNSSTGQRLWNTTIPGNSSSGPAVANGSLYLASTNGEELLAYHLPKG